MQHTLVAVLLHVPEAQLAVYVTVLNVHSAFSVDYRRRLEQRVVR